MKGSTQYRDFAERCDQLAKEVKAEHHRKRLPLESPSSPPPASLCVALELMDHREVLEIGFYENGAHKALRHSIRYHRRLIILNPDNRKLVELTAVRRRLLQDTYHAAWMTCRESHALIARSHGKLYLTTDHGEKTIRD